MRTQRHYICFLMWKKGGEEYRRDISVAFTLLDNVDLPTHERQAFLRGAKVCKYK